MFSEKDGVAILGYLLAEAGAGLGRFPVVEPVTADSDTRPF